uniref:Uncharacterized protein n=1 Tax=Anguilla anguilla TaxID=7936 RepID=A0A0E9RED9_ANGAN
MLCVAIFTVCNFKVDPVLNVTIRVRFDVL